MILYVSLFGDILSALTWGEGAQVGRRDPDKISQIYLTSHCCEDKENILFERVQGLEEDNFDVKTLSSISINVLTLLSGSHCSLGAEVTTCFSTAVKIWK